MTNEVKSGIDVAAVAGGIGSWFAIIPDVAAILSIVWLALRIWETETVKRWTGRET
jgi:Na+/proline symporter